MRDGWSTRPRETENDARRLGVEDPILHVHLPRKSADRLKDRIIGVEAARQVLDHYGTPTSPEGQEARDSMQSRQDLAAQERDDIIRDIIHSATVLQGGGSEIFGTNLGERLETGAEASLARLFHRFGDADHGSWEAALRRARDGSDQPLQVVGWDGPTDGHPVAKKVLDAIGAGARGTAIHKKLKAAPYGWPQDALDSILIALHRDGHLRATRNGQPVPTGGLDQAGIKGAEFRPEKVRLTTTQRIALRGLFEKLDVRTRAGQEEIRAPEFLDALVNLGHRAGGRPPLPATPDTTFVDNMKRLTGNEQLAEIHKSKDHLTRQIEAWTEIQERARGRTSMWDLATAFRRRAEDLPVTAKIGPELDAIQAQRSLLAESDPVRPLVATLATALREALTAMHSDLMRKIQAAGTTLAGDTTWSGLDTETQDAIRRRLRLDAPPALSVGTDGDLRSTLDTRPLSAWRSEIDAVDARIAQALDKAAEHLLKTKSDLHTTTIRVRRGTLADETAVREWLQEQEESLVEAVKNGPVIVR